MQHTQLVVEADLNTVLRMCPERVCVTTAEQQACWVESLLSLRQAAAPELAAAVTRRLQQLQDALTAANAEVGW
jgi:hypothetical protein